MSNQQERIATPENALHHVRGKNVVPVEYAQRIAELALERCKGDVDLLARTIKATVPSLRKVLRGENGLEEKRLYKLAALIDPRVFDPSIVPPYNEARLRPDDLVFKTATPPNIEQIVYIGYDKMPRGMVE